jgi:carbonic anhydrase/acetyltransferase-like protein (isoleucine patch superfamily)
MSDSDDPNQALERRLARLQAAMGPKAARKAERAARREERRTGKGTKSGISMVAMALAFLAAAIATNNHGLYLPAFILAALGAARMLERALNAAPKTGQAHIGMGANIESGAIIEPGAVVEMGADVKAGARICSGAVVRMGSTVKENAVIESGAVVGWGCSIEAGAVVEAGAMIGAGSTVRQGSRVPAGMKVAPGAAFSNAGASAPQAKAPVADERRARIEAACAKIEAEIAQLPATFREHLGATGETAASLRQTCLTLLDRERTLRSEASEDGLKFLDTERLELEKRAAAATDAQVKKSLESAVGAIDEQKRQRLQVKTHADRIDAEVTRLQWTLDGMAAQLVRLRSAGVDASQPPGGEVLKTVQQLGDEIDAIADALEHVRETEHPMLQPISPISSSDESLPKAPGERAR